MLDIQLDSVSQVKEIDWNEMAKGRKVYEPPQYMTVNTAIKQILEILPDKTQEERSLLNEKTLCVGVARLGTDEQCIKSG